MRGKDILGKRFGYLTVVKHSQRRNAAGQHYWICQCHCGRYLVVRGDNLRRGTTRQCTECSRRGRPSAFVIGVVEDGVV